MYKDSKITRAMERLRENALHPLKVSRHIMAIGDVAKDGSIYAGLWQHAGAVFDLFVSPHNLLGHNKKKTMNMREALEIIPRLRNWHGHDGENVAYEDDLHTVLAADRYKGGWFVPTMDMLRGSDLSGRETQTDNLFAHRNTGAFKDTFELATRKKSTLRQIYWSCSRDKAPANHSYAVNFEKNGKSFMAARGIHALSVRPVRLELR